jgi:hypothetical protein
VTATFARAKARATVPHRGAIEHSVPLFLAVRYWWAYVRPKAVKLFERQWLVNLILWGNNARLRDAALTELGDRLSGRTLQVACVYGDLTDRLAWQAARGGGAVDVIDVLPIQDKNLRGKLATDAPVRSWAMDSTDLRLPDAKRTISEGLRVVKPGGKIVILDDALPRWWHPLGCLWRPVLARLEPFALDPWRREIADWLSASFANRRLRHGSFFGGLYQKVVVTR